MNDLEKKEIHEKLAHTKLLPLYTVTDLDCLETLEKLLVKYELRFIEITFRSELALEAIQILSKSGELIVGAGTVRTIDEAKSAVEQGAKFIVSPAVIPEVIEYCLSKKIPVFPGTATPTEIQRVFEYGIRTVKFFPADVYGGLKAINALSGPFYDMKFLPTGGIGLDNFIDYLKNDNIIAVGGSFIILEEELKEANANLAEKRLSKIIGKMNEAFDL